MILAVARCGSPACRTLTEAVVEDDATLLKCAACWQVNPVLTRKAISNGRCARCKGVPLDDHQWIDDQAVCRR